jgi:hypothetical protein
MPGDAMPIPTHGVEHHIHKGSYPPVGLQNSAALIQKNLEINKAEYKRMESAVLVRCSKSPWASSFHMVPPPKKKKRWIMATLWRLSLSQLDHNP